MKVSLFKGKMVLAGIRIKKIWTMYFHPRSWTGRAVRVFFALAFFPFFLYWSDELQKPKKTIPGRIPEQDKLTKCRLTSRKEFQILLQGGKRYLYLLDGCSSIQDFSLPSPSSRCRWIHNRHGILSRLWGKLASSFFSCERKTVLSLRSQRSSVARA